MDIFLWLFSKILLHITQHGEENLFLTIHQHYSRLFAGLTQAGGTAVSTEICPRAPPSCCNEAETASLRAKNLPERQKSPPSPALHTPGAAALGTGGFWARLCPVLLSPVHQGCSPSMIPQFVLDDIPLLQKISSTRQLGLKTLYIVCNKPWKKCLTTAPANWSLLLSILLEQVHI